MGNAIPELGQGEIDILNTPFSKLPKEMWGVAFAICDKLTDINASLNKEYSQLQENKALRFTVQDKDKLLADGVKSPINRKAFHNRREWNEHLKRNGCVEIGNDFNNVKPSKELKGDFNCRKELTQATYQIAEKYGH